MINDQSSVINHHTIWVPGIPGPGALGSPGPEPWDPWGPEPWDPGARVPGVPGARAPGAPEGAPLTIQEYHAVDYTRIPRR